MVNRAALLLRYKEPFVQWINTSNPDEKDQNISIEEANQDKIVDLIDELRTNMHFTLKKNPLSRRDLDDFVACYQADNPAARQETERFKRFRYEE